VHVEVIYALPDAQHRAHLEVEPGATLADALNMVRRISPFSELDLERVPVGVYGHPADRGRLLEPDDRVEIYRPLLIDPKEARRRRAANG
jgi:hypothetical protein